MNFIASTIGVIWYKVRRFAPCFITSINTIHEENEDEIALQYLA